MTDPDLSVGRVGLILMIISQCLYIPSFLINLHWALDMALSIFSIVATLLAVLIFRYFSDVYGSTIAKVTFVMTLIATVGLVFDLLVVLAGLFFLPLVIAGAILLLFTLPAIIVFYILWGVTFVQVSGDCTNRQLMLAGGITFLVGWTIGLGGLFDIINVISQVVSIIGLILVTIVLFSEDEGGSKPYPPY